MSMLSKSVLSGSTEELGDALQTFHGWGCILSALNEYVVTCSVAKTTFAEERERLDMNAKNFKTIIGTTMAAALLAALPASAGSGQIKVTHANTPYQAASQPASSAQANAQPMASQTTPSEIQVAVMAKSPPPQAKARRSIAGMR
jgi:hypothetical protein